MADRIFRVSCRGERHQIVLRDDNTVSYPSHNDDIEELVSEARRPALLAVLAGLKQPDIHLDGCALVCAGMQANFRVAHYPDTGVRGIFATVAGRKLGERLAQKKRTA
jgi:hypothetical protein